MINENKLGLIELRFALEEYGTEEQIDTTLFILQTAFEKFNCKLIGLSDWIPQLKDAGDYIKCLGLSHIKGNLFANGMSKSISIFKDDREEIDTLTWPTAWNIVHYLENHPNFKTLDIGSGCGNTGQHSLRSKYIIPGVYKIVKKQWTKIR